MYPCRAKVPTPILCLSDPPSPVVDSSHHTLPLDLNLFIALHKGDHSFIARLLSHFVSYDKLTPFANLLFVLCFFFQVVSGSCVIVHAWQQTMNEEIQMLVSQET